LVLLIISIAGIVGCATQDMELSNEGFQEISRKNYGQAEKSLDKALFTNPDNPYALLNMGVVYQETGRLDKARQMYEKVIALQPKDVAEESNTGSLAGKGLVEIAKANLKLLEEREAQLAASRKPVETAPQSTAAFEASKGTPLAPPLEKKGSAPAAAVSALSPPEPKVPAKEAFYKVRKNDSLSDIAGRLDVYRDALKWPSLFRLNMSALEKMKMTESLPVEKLPEGLRLKYVSREQASENLAAMVDKLWVVDVASAKSMKGVVPPAILLMRKGYHAYLTKSQLAGEEWIRLRVGFYEDILEALKASEDVKSLLNMSETPMPMKIERRELERFAGY
jgi:tetratricopeptide (TPR) repeat protein